MVLNLILAGLGPFIGILVVMLVFFVFISLIMVVRRYRRCPSDKILVIYGKVGQSKTGGRTSKIVHGGAAFVWPIIQDYEFLDLTPVPIVVDLQGALSLQNIRVNVPSRFMVGISTEQGVMQNAAERMLGLSLEAIHDLAADIIFGQLRVVIATMRIEEINSDREKFLTNVYEAVEHELKKLGLKLINVNITDVTDDNGYIEALGKEATAHAINEAKKLVAEKDRDGSIGEANARNTQRVKVAEASSEAEIGEANAMQIQRVQVADANTTAEIGEANANRLKRTQVAEANAKAVEGENLSQIVVADSEANKRKEMAVAQKVAEVAEKTNKAESEEESYKAEQKAETARALRDEATRRADVIVPAQIAKERIEIEAEAEAESLRRIAKGNADSEFFKLDAIARGNFEILTKQAEGFKQIVAAAGNNPNDAVRLMIADKLEDLVSKQVEAIKNIKIDKVTVWENGNGAEGGSSTANFMKGMAGSIPPLEDLFNMAGMELPAYLRTKKEQGLEEDFETDVDDEIIEG